MIDIFPSKIACRWLFRVFTAGYLIAVQVDSNKDSLVDPEDLSTALRKWLVPVACSDM